MVTFRHFEEIEAWKLARSLARSVYAVTSRGELRRDYPLRDQMRRSAISVSWNIAEGFERDGANEFVQFLYIAKGSCAELRSQLYIAWDQAYITAEEFEELQRLCHQVGRVIHGLAAYLRRSHFRGKKYL